jgi:hypothetical protein
LSFTEETIDKRSTKYRDDIHYVLIVPAETISLHSVGNCYYVSILRAFEEKLDRMITQSYWENIATRLLEGKNNA